MASAASAPEGAATPASAPQEDDAVTAHRTQRDALVADGLLLSSGVDGLYGRSAAFERVVDGLSGLVGALGREMGATVVRFPPVIARPTFLRTDYLRSFPDMSGEVWSFRGGDREHADLLARVEADEPWGELMEPTEVVLVPAVCHPLYPTLASPVPEGGALFDVLGWVFRHEPSVDPARQVAFRQHELVYVGDAEGARHHRDRSLAQALEIAADLGLDATSTLANDPFFGRAGRMLKANQRATELKYEVLAFTSGAPEPTAVVSANCHEDHFGASFDLRTADGEVAHTACVGYGLERLTLALVWAHGPDPERWPESVRRRLWP